MKTDHPAEVLNGIAFAAGAYILWGLLPIYWKLVQSVPSPEVLAHRIVWSFVLMIVILLATRKLRSFCGELREIIANPKKLFGVFMASLFITFNWFTYIWAVNDNRVIETSLGYYINPLVSVLLGIFVLKEKLSFWQMVSFLLAMIGVLNMTLQFGAVPWAALALAVSFGLYGLCKKMVHLGAITGITTETLIISPFALLYLTYIHKSGSGSFGAAYPDITALLIGAGIVTAVPLILFSKGANRLPLTIIGFLQYIAPTIALLLGVFLYHEPFTSVHMVSFAFIWVALLIFSLAKTKSFVQLESWLLKKASVKKGETA
ncbi:MAG: EamA family transporter RarD [Bacillota bacterium]